MSESAAPSPPRRAWLVPAVIAAGVLLHLPSLAGGFYADDHMHQLALDGKLPLRPWALYDFGGTADWAHLQDSVGGFPWWTSPDWKIRFFRPLTSVLLWLEHAFFGHAAAGYHGMSLAWLAALLTTTYGLHRALGLSRGVAAAAVALLAASQATIYPTDWIANRNSLLAATFTTGAVAAIASHRRLGRGRALATSLGLAALACLSKESGVAAFAAVAAYLVVAGHGLPAPWARRAAAASAACAALFVVAVAAAGFGTHCAFYATPWSDPGRWLANLGKLGAVGALSLVTPALSDLTFLVPSALPAFVAGGIVVGSAVGAWALRRLRGERTAAFLAVWTALSLLPEAGAPLQDRLLLTATVGAAGLLAMLLARTLPAAAGRSRFERGAAWTVVVLAGIEALATLGQSATTSGMAHAIREKATSADVGPRELGRREVFLLQADDPLVAFTIASTWALHTGDVDVRFTQLQTGRRGLRWTRVDERTMEFESLDRPFVTDPFETVYRADATPPAPGTVVEVPRLRFEVARTDADGRVRAVRVRFDEPPDGPRFRFLVPRDGRLTHVAPPAPGASVDLPRADSAHAFVP
jgi:hypothetical protein